MINKNESRPRLLFVSARFLFPADTGGQIRTSQVLRGMKGGVFDITLASPAPANAKSRFGDELDSVANHFVSWPQRKSQGWLFGLTRMRHLFARLPIPVITDWSKAAKSVVDEQLASMPDMVVFDFPHSVVLAPDKLNIPSVLFTHNVEAEIFRRHVIVAGDPVRKYIWNNQYRKMFAFERRTISMFDEIVAVSERDKETFQSDFGASNVSVIRTGVDLDFFAYSPPGNGKEIVFTGSMDWMANIDGIEYFLEQVWPIITAQYHDARMTVVGRNPPEQLKEKARDSNWEFTGLVDDIRPHMRNAAVYVVPLRVGGGTRMKVFEAMASGCPLVSTGIGVEGLPLIENEHYLKADSPKEIARAVLELLDDRELREKLARNARQYVEDNFSCVEAARDFEQICTTVMNRHNADRET